MRSTAYRILASGTSFGEKTIGVGFLGHHPISFIVKMPQSILKKDIHTKKVQVFVNKNHKNV